MNMTEFVSLTSREIMLNRNCIVCLKHKGLIKCSNERRGRASGWRGPSDSLSTGADNDPNHLFNCCHFGHFRESQREAAQHSAFSSVTLKKCFSFQ